MQLEGGAFQSLFDEYLYKKYKFTNIQTLGVQTATNTKAKGRGVTRGVSAYGFILHLYRLIFEK